MDLKIETRPNDYGGTDYLVRGDSAFFWWLINSAGSARDGFKDVFAGASDGSGDRIVLDPLQPLPEADQKRRSVTARNNTPPAPKGVTPEEVAALTAKVAELQRELGARSGAGQADPAATERVLGTEVPPPEAGPDEQKANLERQAGEHRAGAEPVPEPAPEA